MNKKGIVLVFSLIVVMVLSILASSLFVKSINENSLVRRHIGSLRAFWLAEAGIAEAVGVLSEGIVSGTLGGSDYAYTATTTALSDGYYQIDSTGTMSFPSGGSASRSIRVIIKTGVIDPTKFQFAIESTTDLDIRGSVDINPDDSSKEYSTLDFADLFGFSKAEIEGFADHVYTPATFPEAIDGITWVNVPTGDTLTVAGDLVGSGILVVSGDTHFSGTVNFSGIIYIIGELTISGNVNTYGSVLAESSTTVDTDIHGNPELNYDIDAITDALTNIQMLTRQIVYWQEI